MPTFSRWAIRSALIYLLLGGTLGGLLLLMKVLPFWGWMWALRPAHVALMLGGWMLQLGFGVADWILPRRYGRIWKPWLVWAAWLLANAGLVVISGAAFFEAAAPLLRLIGYGLETLAGLLMLLDFWPRVRSMLPAKIPSA